MMRWLTLLALVVFVPRDSEAQEAPAQGPAIVAALTQERVDIRSDFAGTQLILFGAAQGLRETDDIVIVVRGPRENLRVMRADRPKEADITKRNDQIDLAEPLQPTENLNARHGADHASGQQQTAHLQIERAASPVRDCA